MNSLELYLLPSSVFDLLVRVVFDLAGADLLGVTDFAAAFFGAVAFASLDFLRAPDLGFIATGAAGAFAADAEPVSSALV